MKTLLFIFALALTLTGCASNDYALYADGQARADIARHTADAAKYKAMADIAASGTEAAKVAAVIAMMGQGGAAPAGRLQAPQASEALQWVSILVPGLTQIAGIVSNARVATAQSNNAARVAESTNGTLLGIAGKIQAPSQAAANVSNVTTTTTSTSTDRHDSASTILSGTGTLGGGAYSTAANPITTTDRHDVYTPAPVVTVVPTVIAPVVQVVPVVPTVPVVITPVVPVVPVVIVPPVIAPAVAVAE